MTEIHYNTVARKPGAFPPDPLPTVLLMVGGDDGLKREALFRLRSAALDDSFADFDQESIDLSLGSASEDAVDPVARIAEAVGAAPFSSPRRVVTVVSVQKLTKERQDALALFLPRIPPMTLLVLLADAAEMEAGKPKGRQIELALRKAAAKNGVVLVCDSAEGADLRTRAADLLAAAGKSYENGVVEALIAASVHPGQPGGDLNALTHEAAKLIDYVGDRSRITKTDAEAVLPAALEENIFRLLDALGFRDLQKSMRELDALLLAEARPDATAARFIVMVQRHFRLLMLAKYLAERRLLGRNALPAEIKEMLPGEMASFAAGQAYRVSAYAKQAVNFTWDELRGCIGRILACDLSAKGIAAGVRTMPPLPNFGDDAATTLRLLVLDLCVRGK